MTEIERLRRRLQNVGRGVKEYTMTLSEAQNLLIEIEDLRKQACKQNLREIVPVIEEKPTVIRKVFDGGTF